MSASTSSSTQDKDAPAAGSVPRDPTGSSRAGRRVLPVVAAGSFIISAASFVYFYSQGMTNVYGDGVAHLNIARKVVDYAGGSVWQRYIQIGSPWLPLHTVLMLPLVWSDRLWRTGIAGSIVSMLSFILATVCTYAIAARLYSSEAHRYGPILPLLSAGVFALNPSVLYLQATPMTETLFMAALATSSLLLLRWSLNQRRGTLFWAAGAVSVATLSRYEAWPAAALAVALVALLAKGGARRRMIDVVGFSSIAAIGPAYWLWHNWAIYGNALEFLTGPFSARGLFLQNRINLGWSNIFIGHLSLDIGLMLLTVLVCLGPSVVLLGAAGLVRLLAVRRAALIPYSPLLLLAVPFFFHVVSLYRGEIQLFPLSAFGLLNVRYGVPDLLAISVLVPATVPMLRKIGFGKAGLLMVCLLVIGQYVYMLSDGPSQLAVYQEGFRNGVNSRAARERARVSDYLKENPPGTPILMHTGALGPVIMMGGLRFSGIIHEGTARWHQVVDDIPGDVQTVIIQKDDPLDKRISESAGLVRDLDGDFAETFSTGSISVFERRRALGH